MGSKRTIIALIPLMAAQGCSHIGALEALGGKCTQEQLTVTWPATITRGSSTTGALLVHTLTPSNVNQAQFNQLRQALVQGGDPLAYNVTWTVSAFETNGGYISFTHQAPLTSGASQQITSTFNGAGWGAAPFQPAPWAVSMRADNFTATSATGTITALNSAPLRLRIDVTAQNNTGESIRVTGDAGFNYAKVTKPCID
ncbi:MAG TPA: hypothetical protein VF042_07805 [Gemmatimonadaceae bacterium]